MPMSTRSARKRNRDDVPPRSVPPTRNVGNAPARAGVRLLLTRFPISCARRIIPLPPRSDAGPGPEALQVVPNHLGHAGAEVLEPVVDQAAEPGVVEDLARDASVALAVVDDPRRIKAHDLADQLGALPDRETSAGADVDYLVWPALPRNLDQR